MAKSNIITLLAPTLSGKTYYLAGTCAIMEVGVDGFTMACRNIALGNKLRRKIWGNLIKGQRPLRNTTFEQYPFDFNYGGVPFLEFDILDYPGDVMEEVEGEETPTAKDDIE
jgi:hypothetical protein